jgi:hypothetical protein
MLRSGTHGVSSRVPDGAAGQSRPAKPPVGEALTGPSAVQNGIGAGVAGSYVRLWSEPRQRASASVAGPR